MKVDKLLIFADLIMITFFLFLIFKTNIIWILFQAKIIKIEYFWFLWYLNKKIEKYFLSLELITNIKEEKIENVKRYKNCLIINYKKASNSLY